MLPQEGGYVEVPLEEEVAVQDTVDSQQQPVPAVPVKETRFDDGKETFGFGTVEH